MEHRQLGRTGVSVSKFCLGAMMFGAWGNPDHDESIRIIHAALDAGINFIDTADVYGQGESEEIVGKALAGGRRDDVILATKFHNAMGEDPNERGNARRWIMRAVEDRCGGWAPTGSTSTKSTASIRRRTSRRHCRRSATSCTRARSATSGPPRSLPARSSKRSGSRATGTCSGSSPSSRRTRCSSVPPRPTSCPRACATGWPSCPTAP